MSQANWRQTVMRLSTTARYGARAMVDLAGSQEAGPVNLRHIAHRQEVSRRYLEHIVLRLQSSGLVRSVRGSGGGFALSRPASEITLADIVEALEGRISVVPCTEDLSSCHRRPFCVTRDVWAEVAEAIHTHLSGITLADLAARQIDKLEAAAATYSI